MVDGDYSFWWIVEGGGWMEITLFGGLWRVEGGWRLLFLMDCGGWMVDGGWWIVEGGLTILCFCLAMISSNQTLYGPDVVHLLLHLLILLK